MQNHATRQFARLGASAVKAADKPQLGCADRPARSSGVSLVVVDDNALVAQDGELRPRRGDFYRFAAQLGRRARKVTLCSPVLDLRRGRGRAWRRAPLYLEELEVIPTFPYTRLKQYVRKLPLALLQNAPVFARAMRAGDLVLIRVPAANAALAFVIARVLRKPVVLFLVGLPAQGAISQRHGPVLRTVIRFAAWLEWAIIIWMARRAPVFAYGSHLAERLRRSGARRVSVTFTSLVDRIPAPTGRRAGTSPLRILYVGRFAPEKGIDVLLAALKLVIASGFPAHLDLVGDGPLASEIRSQASPLEGTAVRLHGWLPEGADLDRLFDEADLFVLPSTQEGIPKVLLKAMAYGLPIVATRAGGIPDIVADGEQGLLVPAGDPVRLAQALRRVLTDPRLRQQLGNAGRRFASSHTASQQANLIWRDISSAFPGLNVSLDGAAR
jgi:glycosyltransferase involved in cell wall biosynthesis